MNEKMLSVIVITKNSDSLLDKCLKSISEISDEIIIVDSYSSDKTIDIAQRYKSKIIYSSEVDLGKKRLISLNNATSRWILALDYDEIVSRKLREEISSVIYKSPSNISGYVIPFQNHFLGKPIKYGGENYKIMRLFRRDSVTIQNSLLHEKFEIKGNIAELNNKINHYSYQSLVQMIAKFTNYAWRGAHQKKKSNEKVTLNKLILYPLHMFWSRFYEDKGYKDGIFRIPLDLGFAYMEFLTYFFMIFLKRKL